MELQVLISTMHQDDYKLLERMNIKSNAIVINQCDKCDENNFIYNSYKIKWINSSNRGLSNSRNNAIKMAQSDICLLADDDLEYVDNYKSIILDEFFKFPNADMIVFQVHGIGTKFKSYRLKSEKIGYLKSMKTSSVEIAFKLESIRKNGIQFDELFGAGAKYSMGEENIFLFRCLKKKLKIVYVPIKIADLNIGNSTWFNGYNKEYFISRGAVFTNMSKIFSLLFITQFAIRKYKLYKKDLTITQALKYMLKGRRQYLNEVVL